MEIENKLLLHTSIPLKLVHFIKICFLLILDEEKDEINVLCEEDFRLYIENGKKRKIYFRVREDPNESELQEMETGTEAAGGESEGIENEGPCKKSKRVHRIKRRHSEHDKRT